MQMETKKSQVSVLVSDKIDFNPKIVIRDTEGHYIMIRVSVQQDNVTFIDMYAPNIGAPKYIKQVLTDLKEEQTAIV